ncbi:MAG: FxsB family radical SAM/SPASM domain protein [Acidobacteria bacterium]|nr:FxsB family radical SAM/SPASM domain protein [Acidobacteriota bacterium]
MSSSALIEIREQSVIPFHTYLWKIASRCNLNCSYCYVYNRADQRWRQQPHFMSEQTARQTALRVREHLEAHKKEDLGITFHGGEPMLGGVNHLQMLLEVIDQELISQGFKVRLAMQTNLTLFTEEIGDLLLKYNVCVGTSLDGPPELNDLFRIDHQGRPSSAAVEHNLQKLRMPPYQKLFAGILCVINPFSSPIRVLDHLLRFSPPGIDFLLPLNNHDDLPLGKVKDKDSTAYGDWLIRTFDHWWELGAPSEIRIFNSILRLCCGMSSGFESLGLDPVDLVVVETNGDIEGVDSLKAAYEGATCLSCNVFENDFDTVASHEMVRFRQNGLNELCQTCCRCPVVKICGGGYIPHRYSAARGFDNPSVYCRDLEKIIRHIHATLKTTINSATCGDVFDVAGHSSAS